MKINPTATPTAIPIVFLEPPPLDVGAFVGAITIVSDEDRGKTLLDKLDEYGAEIEINKRGLIKRLKIYLILF